MSKEIIRRYEDHPLMLGSKLKETGSSERSRFSQDTLSGIFNVATPDRGTEGWNKNKRKCQGLLADISEFI